MSPWPPAEPSFGNTEDLAPIETVFLSKRKPAKLHSGALQPVVKTHVFFLNES